MLKCIARASAVRISDQKIFLLCVKMKKMLKVGWLISIDDEEVKAAVIENTLKLFFFFLDKETNNVFSPKTAKIK